MIVGAFKTFNILHWIRHTPCGSASATRLLCYGKRHALVECSAEESHLSGVRTTSNTDVLHVDACYLFTQQLQTIEQSAESPCPLAICTVVLQFRIKSVEVVLAAVVVRSPLSLAVVVNLRLVESHHSDASFLKQLSRQRYHARANHERVRCLACLRICDVRFQIQFLISNSYLHVQSVKVHPCLDVLFLNGRFLANLKLLYACSNLVASFLPLFEFLHASLAVEPRKRVGQGGAWSLQYADILVIRCSRVLLVIN